ncbi:MAG: glycosyltransferase family 4 protein [Fimbriimonadaceae bacterium]|nr:glycosyltransferase family 4 protein [Fimbriimonadaceae bacterium]
MRVVVHDYPGHMFPLSLSRELARRGHEVLHLYSASFVSPHGELVRRADDSPHFDIKGITLAGGVFDKTNLFRRRQADIEHGELARQEVERFTADWVLTCSSPLDAVKAIQASTHRQGGRHLFWLQDLIGIAADKIMRHKVPIVGGVIGKLFVGYERRLLADADAVVVITEDFRPFVPEEQTNVHVVENWSPIDQIPLSEKQNEWSRSKGLDQTTNWVYTGTLGMKHNPGLLLKLAEEHRSDPSFRLVVVSEGSSVDWLRENAAARGLENVVLLPFQSVDDFPQVLGSADVLVAILEPSAGVFSVPSKVLSYLSSGRAILLAVPPENLIARIVTGHNAGLAVSPLDEAAFIEAARELGSDPERRRQMGANGRAYAAKTFDVGAITDRFEAIFNA